MKLVAIVGSPRLRGNTNYLVDQALKEATKLGRQMVEGLKEASSLPAATNLFMGTESEGNSKTLNRT